VHNLNIGPADAFVGAVARCPAGKHVLGGGGDTTGVIIMNEPGINSADIVDGSNWEVLAVGTSNTGNIQVSAYAICATTPPPLTTPAT
jgi:hypothetical protein